MNPRHGLLGAVVAFAVVVLWAGAASAQSPLITLGSLPGLAAPERSVGTAIDTLCPKLAGISQHLNSSQKDLLDRCSDMKVSSPSRGLGEAVLPDVLGTLWPGTSGAQGSNAVETRSMQLQSVGARLGALRLGATGIALNGWPFDGKTAVASASEDPNARGGGASADTGALGGLGLFVNGVGNFGSQDSTDNVAGFDYHTAGIIAGADYRITNSLIAGAAFSYLRTNSALNASLGTADSQGYGLSLYGTYYIGGFYVDLLGGFSYNTYDLTRQIVYGPAPGFGGAPVNRTAKADPDGWEYTFNGGAGYDFHAGPVTLTPYGRMEYLNLRVSDYREKGADGLDLKVQSQTVESLLAIIGGRIGYAISTSVGVFVPQVRGEWRHEILNDSRSVRAQFANDPFGVPFTVFTDNPDRDYFSLGASLSGNFQRGVSAFVDFSTILGLNNVTNYNFTAGVRVEF